MSAFFRMRNFLLGELRSFARSSLLLCVGLACAGVVCWVVALGFGLRLALVLTHALLYSAAVCAFVAHFHAWFYLFGLPRQAPSRETARSAAEGACTVTEK